MNKQIMQAIAILSASITLAACGGGSDNTAANASASSVTGKETASGTVTGFGSVYVEGVRYDDRSAKISIENDSAAPKAGAVSDVKLGMQVEVTTDASGQATAVTISAQVIGAISSMTADGLVVAGQTVKVSTDFAAPTVFDSVAGLSGLAVNDRVEVHGTRDANNAILATRITRTDATAPMVVRVVGAITNLDTASKSFNLGGLVVNYAATTKILPTGAVLANGETVKVWTDQAPAGTALIAKSIVVKRKDVIAEGKLRIGGHITDLDFAAKRFKIDGFDVDATNAAFEKGAAADLANGRRVRVLGAFTNGKVVATDVKFVRNQGDAMVELKGAVSDFVSLSSFKLRGVPIDASGAGVVFKDGSAENLGNGVAIEIEGQVANNVVKPSKVEFANSENSGTRTFFGMVSNYTATAGTFSMLGLSMKLQDSTRFKNGDGTAATRADFGNADRVRVKGSWATGVLQVIEVMFTPAASALIAEVEGGVYDFDASNGSFKINGVTVTTNTATVFEGNRANLRNGAVVEVDGTVVDGKLVATKVEIKTVNDAITTSVRGEITDFVSASDFRVAGQKIDASAATFVSGSAAALANGSVVEAKGAVVDGVLKAGTMTVSESVAVAAAD